MKLKALIGLAFALSGSLLGCSSITVNRDANEQIQLPIKFGSYHDLYAFIAKNNLGDGLSTDAKTIFKLAADSSTDIIGLDCTEIPYVYVIESHFYNGGIYDEIRGAQGNGLYFVVRPLAKGHAGQGFELVGILHGNAYELRHINGKPQFISYWHISAGEHPETVYDWNGKYFEEAK